MQSRWVVLWVGLAMIAHARSAEAVCGGASPNLVAASAMRADVLDCVTAAASGDTIGVPAGAATWATPIDLPDTKDVAIVGATVVTCTGTPIACTAMDMTSITCGNGHCFTIDLAAAHRISGFTILDAANGGIVGGGDQDPTKHFRVDHNHIVSSSGWAPMEFGGGANAVHPQGIVDNNLLVDIAIHTNGTIFGLDEGDQQHAMWAQATPLGDSSAIVYIEDNQHANTAGNINNADSNYAGRYVYRFNSSTSGRQAVEFHSVQGDNRAGQRFEIYGNSGASSVGFSGIAFLRGGSGVVFGNRLAANWPSFGIEMDNVRSERDPGGGVGQCDGTSGWDQNTSGMMGYRCRDQLGASHDRVQWDHLPSTQPFDQVLQPVYLWDNLEGSSPVSISNSGLDVHIAANRDYFGPAASFNGTVGVGMGPIASRPTTCTIGVAYWATDEADWNAKQAGPDGQLYRCTATDTWTLHFRPHNYPHPWAGGLPQPPDPMGDGGGGDVDPMTSGGGGCCQTSALDGGNALLVIALAFALRRRRR